MAEVKPFRGIHYDVKRVGDLTRVVAPPYDVISPEEQEALHRRHPKNITWVDFGMAKEGDGPGENKYTRAAAWFREWLAEGTLVRDAAPSLYYYEQEFTIPGKRAYVRKGFLGALKLSAFGEGEVFPHERTLSKPKEDRLALMRVTDVHMSPIFALYSDPKDVVLKSLRSAMAAAPDMAAVDDLGVKHRVWTVSQPKALLGAVEGMKGKGVFIADGHHRYETALAFRDEMRKKHGANVSRWDLDLVTVILWITSTDLMAQTIQTCVWRTLRTSRRISRTMDLWDLTTSSRNRVMTCILNGFGSVAKNRCNINTTNTSHL